MNFIRRHPVAFASFIAVELIGISFLLAVYPGEVGGWFYAIVGLSSVAGFAILVIILLASLIARIISHRLGKEQTARPNWYTYEAVHDYMSGSRFEAIYWIIICLASPIIPLLLVHVVDTYMVGLMVMGLGLTVFMLIVRKDALESAFFRTKRVDEHFITKSGDDKDLISSLYGEYVHAYLLSSWDDLHRGCIYNALRREKALNGDIRCYTVSNRFLHEHYGTYLNDQIEGYALVPFSQFALNANNVKSLKRFFDSISSSTLNYILCSVYGSKKSLEPDDYAHSTKHDILCPMIGDILNAARNGNDLYLAVTKACQRSDSFKQYYDCLMVIRNARLDGGEDAEQSEQRLIASDTRYLVGFDLSVSGRALTLKVIIDDDTDAENWELDEEEYSPVHEMVYHYDRIEWYYDAFCDASKSAEIFRLIDHSSPRRTHSVEET